MNAAIPTSPLTALIWIFAVLTCALTALAVGALALYVRHKIRRRRGVYARIVAEAPQSISKALTIGDLIADSPLRRQVSPHLVNEDQVPARRNSSPFHGSAELEKWSSIDTGPS